MPPSDMLFHSTVNNRTGTCINVHLINFNRKLYKPANFTSSNTVTKTY